VLDRQDGPVIVADYSYGGQIMTALGTGAFLLAGTTSSRAPVCEHAYDLDDATLAGHHAGDLARVGFPVCQRGWNTPEQAACCLDCDVAMQRAVRDLITAAVGAITSLR
jgi:hypothetical protein